MMILRQSASFTAGRTRWGRCFCLTVDVQSLEDRQVTVRDRDTMKQERINIERLRDYILEKLRS